MEYTFNVAQAAAEMGVCTKQVISLIEVGALPAGKQGKGYVLRKADVFKHIDLVITTQTHDRIRKKSPALNQGADGNGSNRRGRKRAPIPQLPG